MAPRRAVVRLEEASDQELLLSGSNDLAGAAVAAGIDGSIQALL